MSFASMSLSICLALRLSSSHCVDRWQQVSPAALNKQAQANPRQKIHSSQLCPFPLPTTGAAIAQFDCHLPYKYRCRTTSFRIVLPISNLHPLSLLSIFSPPFPSPLSSRHHLHPPLPMRNFSTSQRPRSTEESSGASKVHSKTHPFRHVAPAAHWWDLSLGAGSSTSFSTNPGFCTL